jgi:hypothetical protein
MLFVTMRSSQKQIDKQFLMLNAFLWDRSCLHFFLLFVFRSFLSFMNLELWFVVLLMEFPTPQFEYFFHYCVSTSTSLIRFSFIVCFLIRFTTKRIQFTFYNKLIFVIDFKTSGLCCKWWTKLLWNICNLFVYKMTVFYISNPSSRTVFLHREMPILEKVLTYFCITLRIVTKTLIFPFLFDGMNSLKERNMLTVCVNNVNMYDWLLYVQRYFWRNKSIETNVTILIWLNNNNLW